MLSPSVRPYPEVAGPTIDEVPVLGNMVEYLLEKHGSGINTVLMYGSCLRSGNLFDGLIDLYLICDNYRDTRQGSSKAVANWLLPPNVFYCEVQRGEELLRSKYSIISSADFRRGCSRRAFESYIWGRFAQPAKIIYSRDTLSLSRMETDRLNAVLTFLHRTLPLLEDTGSVRQLWQSSLAYSYASELRTERAGRAGELADTSHEFFCDITRQVAPKMAFQLEISGEGEETHYRATIPPWRHIHARLSWSIRRLHGKLMSVLRLTKALFTFEGGLDYIAWKLERHSGQEIVIPERVRRKPMIFLWGFFWGLYRRGIFK